MSKDDNLHDFLQDVADAIKEKKGSNDAINAQSFADEIKNLPSGSSPFAVDFGEEIASGNPTFINALQEDIDYYNEVQRKRASGEVSDDVLLGNKDFLSKIAWIPPGMQPDHRMLKCVRLYEMPEEVLSIPSANFYNYFGYFYRLKSLKGVCSAQGNDFGFNVEAGNIEEIDILFNQLTQVRQQSLRAITGKVMKVRFPELISIAGNSLSGLRGVTSVHVEIPKVTEITSILRDNQEMEELYVDMPSVTKSNYSIGYNTRRLKKCHIIGLQVSIGLSGHSDLGVDSIKYILDNCQERADGASYTLTLNASAKNAFLAKCDEDAEYAASLASANAKGLTLA